MADSQRGFNVGVFKAELSNKKVLRPNLFLVEFSVPPGLLRTDAFNKSLQTVKTLEYWCEATNHPGVSLQTYQGMRYGYGSIEQRPLLPIFQETNFDFIFDAKTQNYDFFRDWMSMIINFNMSQGINETNGQINTTNNTLVRSTPFELAYKQYYAIDVTLLMYDSEGNVVKKTVMRDAFPKMIGDIRLAWGDNNSYMRIPVVFAFTDWFELPITEPRNNYPMVPDYFTSRSEKPQPNREPFDPEGYIK